jgi:hypothetical protein
LNRRQFAATAAASLLTTSVGAQSVARTPAPTVGGARAASAFDAASAGIQRGESVQDALSAWCAVAREALPFVYMTALRAKVDPEGGPASGDVRRIFSTVPSAYPVGGWTHLTGSDWSRHVLERQQVLVASGATALARYFPDHELLRSLGTRTLVNIPVVVCRRTAGAFAFLCAQEVVDEQAISTAQKLAALAAPVFLLPERADA